jgi:hypothetical protein
MTVAKTNQNSPFSSKWKWDEPVLPVTLPVIDSKRHAQAFREAMDQAERKNKRKEATP